MSGNDRFQVSLMPWFRLKKSITLGPVIFWAYSMGEDRRVSSPDIRKHLAKYFRSYVDRKGKPVGPITICSHSTDDFRRLSGPEFEDVRNAVDVLAFATIAPQAVRAVCADNDSWAPPTADVFELVTHNFVPGNDYITVETGSRVSAGWRIGEIEFPAPWATGGLPATPDEKLTTGLHKCFSPAVSEDIGARVFRSLEWFRMAHIEGGDVSVLSRMVMMATAFEILLVFPQYGKRQHFVDYLEQRIADSSFNRDDRVMGKGKLRNLSLAGCWAWDFYELRNRIVHGDVIGDDELVFKDWITHLIVADLVFWECLTRELVVQRCMGNDIYQAAKAFNEGSSDEPDAEVVEELTKSSMQFDEVHEAFGWVSGGVGRG